MRIVGRVLDEVVAHARECRPSECCGLLVGHDDQVVASVRARNLSESPTRFLIDPSDHIAARKDARLQGLDILGFYHSHPHSRAYPSEIDLEEASYPEAVHLIVGLQTEPPDIRLFRLVGGTVTELGIRN